MPLIPAVVLTRETGDNQRLRLFLESRGVLTIECPCVSTRIVEYDGAPLSGGLSLSDFGAVAFSSRRGVTGMRQVAVQLGRGGQLLAAVGTATAEALEALVGRPVDIVPEQHTGQAMARELAQRLAPGDRVLLVRGNKTTGTFQQVMAEQEVKIHELVVYHNLPAKPQRLELPHGAVVVFASPSAVERFFEVNSHLLGSTRAVAIGPTTSRALVRAGHPNVVQAPATEAQQIADTILNL